MKSLAGFFSPFLMHTPFPHPFYVVYAKPKVSWVQLRVIESSSLYYKRREFFFSFPSCLCAKMGLKRFPKCMCLYHTIIHTYTQCKKTETRLRFETRDKSWNSETFGWRQCSLKTSHVCDI